MSRGHGGGQMVCLLTFYSDIPGSNPAGVSGVLSFFLSSYFIWKERIGASDGPLKNIVIS